MTNEDVEQLGKGLQALKDVVDTMINALAKTGYVIPRENDRNFYLRCCWLLVWLNKTHYANNEDLLVVRKSIMDALPVLKDVYKFKEIRS